ncbi:excinuclease ABC subunit UvrC [Sediminitomix flava]|uniref:UvrABC system protein C n=1 Tax=Sediminitomix flava TaxID=379075 RepID=A0A315ZJB4_SEDFL|nr:excinuclease ABC subunit UvrC [Sediminitomix flava]PWJ44928.1 excinuclease ABC subunit C [Sediminitomix flava]
MKGEIAEKLQSKIKNLPQEPGVYKYLNEEGVIIYVGKAKKLKNRVSSYFVKQHDASRKTRKLVSEIRDIETVVVDSELDALLLENNLIKEFQPKYNILLKDDKTYPYICITKERFPRVFSTRNIEAGKHEYYGPYASLRTMNTLLDLFKRLYKIRSCTYNLSRKNVDEGKFKICLEYHIHNCLGPCEGKQTEEEYEEDIKQIRSILKGKIGLAKGYLKDKMNTAAAEMEFEKAAQYKDKLDHLQNFQAKSLVTNPNIEEVEAYSIKSSESMSYVNFMKITDGVLHHTETVQVKKSMDESDEQVLLYAIFDFRKKYNTASRKVLTNIELEEVEELPFEAHVPKIGDMRRLIELSMKNVFHFMKEKEVLKQEKEDKKAHFQTLLQLKADLNLKELPVHIECFDNSNFQGTNPVAACVVFKDGKPSKKDYRHFHIKTVVGPDDFASMYEVVTRRYKRLLAESEPLPQLIIIDGGKGQLGMAVKALRDLEIYGTIPVIGIAKRLEEIYFPGDSLPLHIHKKSRSLALIQRLRDEAHRFGITFHRNRRSANSIHSELENIEGVGPATIKKLLTEFKSAANVKKASQTDIAAVIGNKKAETVVKYFKEKE